jgi:hypothetical protein
MMQHGLARFSVRLLFTQSFHLPLAPSLLWRIGDGRKALRYPFDALIAALAWREAEVSGEFEIASLRATGYFFRMSFEALTREVAGWPDDQVRRFQAFLVTLRHQREQGTTLKLTHSQSRRFVEALLFPVNAPTKRMRTSLEIHCKTVTEC